MSTYEIKNISASNQSWSSLTIPPNNSITINYQNLYDGTASLSSFSDASDVSVLAQEDKIILLIDAVQKTKNETLDFITDIFNGKSQEEINWDFSWEEFWLPIMGSFS